MSSITSSTTDRKHKAPSARSHGPASLSANDSTSGTFVIALSVANSRYAGLSSMMIELRPSDLATLAVVPLPPNGSSTTPGTNGAPQPPLLSSMPNLSPDGSAYLIGAESQIRTGMSNGRPHRGGRHH